MAPTYVIGVRYMALRCGTPHSGTSHSAMSHIVQTVEWVTSVRSVSMSVYLMLWALHVPVQHGTCALSSTQTSLIVVTQV